MREEVVNEMSVAKAGEEDSDAGEDVQRAHEELCGTGNRVAQIAGMVKESFQLAADRLQFRKEGNLENAYAQAAQRGRNEMGGRFEGKVAVVAGGTGGLGRAVSLAFLEEGGKVEVTYVVPEEWEALKEAAGAKRRALNGHEVDVTDEKAVNGLMQKIVAEQGRLDVLVNAVGGYAGGVKLWEMETQVFEKMMALNLRSGYALMRAAARVMLKRGRGAMVNVASKAAYDHAAGAAAYAASKAAALAMMDSLAADLKGSGVRANSILPSIIDTEANRKAMPKADFTKWPKPEEIARVILFLCSEDAKVVQGAAVAVYGES
jgi:NAD(P)-dependent dehydrogenase (short-subunit alcohol dehydrogenase family)